MNDASIILVVEDEELIQAVIEETLDAAGFTVALTSSGEEAVRLLNAVNSEFSSIVTDVNLGQGKLNGWQVARYARELNPNLAVIYMTGDSAAEWSTQCVTNSALLNKPFKPSALITTIVRLLKTGGPIIS